MLIGELAERVGTTPTTIRYYESIGLLPEPERTEAGYRTYGPADLERLAFVRRARDELDRLLTEAPTGSDQARYCGLIEHGGEEDRAGVG